MSDDGERSRYPDGPDSCDSDPNCTPWIQGPTDTMMLALYAYIGVTIGAALLFFMSRKFVELRNKKRELKDGGVVHYNDREEEQVSRRGSVQTNSKIPAQASFASGMDHLDVTSNNNINMSKKDMHEKSGKDAMISSVTLGDEDDLSIDLPEKDQMRLKPYKKSFIGEAVYLLLIGMNCMWFVTLVIIAIDCYNQCQFYSVDAMCFYGNYPVFGSYSAGANYFFAWWCGMLIWFIPWLWFRNEIRNWCRTPCLLGEAKFMWVWVKDEKEVMVSSRYLITTYCLKIFSLFSSHLEGHDITVSVNKLNDGTPFFIHEGTRYVYDRKAKTYYPPVFHLGKYQEDLYTLIDGISTDTAQQRLNLFGENVIPFSVTPWYILLGREFTSWFYLYQLSMYSIQLWNAYVQYALINTFIVTVSGILNVYVQWKGEKTISEITKYSTTCFVLRDSKWKELDAKFLVPGDIVKMKSDWACPCDFVLLKGSCVMNESGLTGESMPVQKVALPREPGKIYDSHGAGVKNTLFASTILLQAGANDQEDVLAVVSGTGINTSKGELISTILFPSQMSFKYDEELSVVVIILAVYGIVMFFLALYFQASNGSTSVWITKWAYGCGTMVQCMNPLLPVALTIGTVRASQRLNNKGVFCINPARISISGKVRVFCFDKTGTLTKEGLDFLGVQPVIDGAFGEMQEATSKKLEMDVRNCLGTCHALAKFGDTFVGNQVEMKMFQATGWELVESHDSHPVVTDGHGHNLEVVKRFEFDHGLQLMSVLVRDEKGGISCYCKGSFEKVELACSGGIPDEYQSVARDYAMNGGYVLSLAYSNLGKMSDSELQNITRGDVEKNLHLLGLIVFRNEIKDDTRQAIDKLKQGDVRPVMITGDNAQCGFYIAKQAGLIREDVGILLGETDKATQRIGWKRMGREFENDTPYQTDQLQSLQEVNNGSLELAVTGNDTYQSLYKDDYIRELLPRIRIFSRMSPESKIHAVEMHKAAGLITAMCGDGGNDCGALRAAHVGVALSDAEASLVSPFTSKSKSVQSCVDLLLDGRACLHTSFGMYKFLICNGLVLSMSKLILLYFGVLMCMMGYIMIDLCATFMIGATMVLALPEKALAKTRPTHSLLGPNTLLSVGGAVTIVFGMTVVAVFYIQNCSGYIQWPANYALGNSWWYQSDNWEASTIYFTQMQCYITHAITFSIGYVYREAIFKNWPFVLCILILYLFQGLFLLLPYSDFTKILHVMSEQFNKVGTDNPIWQAWQDGGNPTSPEMSLSQRLGLFALLAVMTILSFCFQYFVVEGIGFEKMRKKKPSKRVVTHI